MKELSLMDNLESVPASNPSGQSRWPYSQLPPRSREGSSLGECTIVRVFDMLQDQALGARDRCVRSPYATFGVPPEPIEIAGAVANLEQCTHE